MLNENSIIVKVQQGIAMPEHVVAEMRDFFLLGLSASSPFNQRNLVVVGSSTDVKVLLKLDLKDTGAVEMDEFKKKQSLYMQNIRIKVIYFLVTRGTTIPADILQSGCALMKAGKRIYLFALPEDIPSMGHFINLQSPSDFKKIMADAISVIDVLIGDIPAEATKAIEYIKKVIAPLVAAHSDHTRIYARKIEKQSGLPREDLLNIFQQAVIERKGIQGFSIDKKGQLVAKSFDLQYSEQERKDALIVLDECSRWFSSSSATFPTVISWTLVSPFSYAKKQLQKALYKWLLIIGPTGTGKTTIARIAAHIWKIFITQFETSAATIGTVPGLAHLLSRWSFPVLINEAAELFEDKSLSEVTKNAWDSMTVRSVVRGHVFSECASIAPLIMTANKEMRLTAAVLRRVKVLNLSLSDKPSQDQKNKFRQWQANLQKLSPLGAMVYEIVRTDLSILDTDDFEAAGAAVLTQMYVNAGLAVPSWVGLRLPADDQDDEFQNNGTRLEVVNHVHQYVLDRLKSVGKMNVYQENNLRDRLLCLMECNIPSDILFYKDHNVIIKKGFLKYVATKGLEISSLSHLAELLGGEYHRQACLRTLKIRGLSVVRVPFSKLMSRLIEPKPGPEDAI
ncbi:MAG: hypothetical protein WCQ99_00395 [Pseudomonadota bacterium]